MQAGVKSCSIEFSRISPWPDVSLLLGAAWQARKAA